jgi:hypothetical protein
MAQWFERNGIRAVAGPGINGCRQVLLSRSSITHLFAPSSQPRVALQKGDQQ